MEFNDKEAKSKVVKTKSSKLQKKSALLENNKELLQENIVIYNEKPQKLSKNLLKALKLGSINGTNYNLLLNELDKANNENRIFIYLKIFKDLKLIKKQSPLVSLITTKYILSNLEKILDRLEVDKADLSLNSTFYTYERLLSFFDSVIRKSYIKNDNELLIMKNSKRNADLRKIGSLCYMYLILVNYKDDFSTPNNSNMLLIERAFATYFSEIIPEKQYQYIGQSLIKSLDSRSYKTELQKHVYLYVNDNQVVNKLNHEKDELIGLTADLNDTIKELKLKIEQLNSNISTLEQKNLEIVKDNTELINAKTRAENRLEFEVNKYENHFETYKESVVKELKKDLDHEIMGIRNIIENSDQDLSARIERRLTRIEKLIEFTDKRG